MSGSKQSVLVDGGGQHGQSGFKQRRRSLDIYRLLRADDLKIYVDPQRQLLPKLLACSGHALESRCRDLIVQLPTDMPLSRYSPCAFVVVVVKPVRASRMFTSAPGMAAPAGSETKPPRLPVIT